ncbi:MAG: 2-oxoacid:acceptor oxidoreductase family protein [Planctomycetes bacterium]|nr:2-oxoacid:acceptor oxidoreductase family protein [Planctomycetota bacterium]
MIEIRFHGRGGQGAVIASKLLAQAAFIEGKHVQSFPAFGVERRGAPVAAFTRIDDRKIHLRTNIYEPDHIVVLDAGLLGGVDVAQGLKPEGWIVVNTRLGPGELGIAEGHPVACVNASGIAVEHGLGTTASPIVNTAILGALAASTGIVAIESVLAAIRKTIPMKTDRNIDACRLAFEQTKTSRNGWVPEVPWTDRVLHTGRYHA